MSASTHFKGFDFFSSTYYATGGDYLIEALRSGGVEVEHQPSHQAAKDFPFELADLQRYQVIVLSDIGANTLLLPPQVFLEGKRLPNRLERLKEFVYHGGGLVMAGGYLSFQGIYGAAQYARSPLAEVLPVTLLPVDDRVEKPQGVDPVVLDRGHPITKEIAEPWPYLLGFNEAAALSRGKPSGRG